MTLKLPTFWTAQQEVCSFQAEAEFTLCNIIADQTKYTYVVASLDQSTATRILDFLRTPPLTNRYDALKQRLSKTFTLSKRDRANALLNMPQLGDQKPSELMDAMLALAGDDRGPLFEQLF